MTETCAAFRAWKALPLKDADGNNKGEPPCKPCAEATALRQHAEEFRQHAAGGEAHAEQLIVGRHPPEKK